MQLSLVAFMSPLWGLLVSQSPAHPRQMQNVNALLPTWRLQNTWWNQPRVERFIPGPHLRKFQPVMVGEGTVEWLFLRELKGGYSLQRLTSHNRNFMGHTSAWNHNEIFQVSEDSETPGIWTTRQRFNLWASNRNSRTTKPLCCVWPVRCALSINELVSVTYSSTRINSSDP